MLHEGSSKVISLISATPLARFLNFSPLRLHVRTKVFSIFYPRLELDFTKDFVPSVRSLKGLQMMEVLVFHDSGLMVMALWQWPYGSDRASVAFRKSSFGGSHSSMN